MGNFKSHSEPAQAEAEVVEIEEDDVDGDNCKGSNKSKVVQKSVPDDKAKNKDKDKSCGGSGGGEEEEVEEETTGFAAYPISRRQSKSLHLFRGCDIQDVEEIGVGFFGKTFKGNIQGRGNEKKRVNVAVKMFHVSLSLEECNAQLVKLMEMKHRNVVSMIGVVVDDSNDRLTGPMGPRIVLQYFPEGSLVNYLAKKENPKDFAMLGKLALDVISGCIYLHDHNVIHGSLSARNVLVQRSARKHQTHFNAKVSDYGISQLDLDFQTLAEAAEKETTKQKQPNEYDPSSSSIEPIRWMPKELVEQIPGGPLHFTREADVWSFGVVLWEMWTKGALPFGSFSQEEIRKFVVQEGKSPLSIHRPHGCPKQIVGVMELIFKVNPTDRPTFEMLFDCFSTFRIGENNNSISSRGSRRGRKEDPLPPPPRPLSNSRRRNRDRERQCQKESSSSSLSSQSSQSQSQSQIESKSQSKLFGSSSLPPPPANNRNRERERERQRERQRSSQSQSMSMSASGAPPPYSALPLPSHSNYSGPGQSLSGPALESEIQRRERELQQLKTKHLQDEFMKKQAEMDEIMRKMAETTQGGGGDPRTTSISREGIPPLLPSYDSRDRDRDRGGRGRDRGGRPRRRRGGRGRSRNRGRNNDVGGNGASGKGKDSGGCGGGAGGR